MGLAFQIWIVFLHLPKTERDDVVVEQLAIVQSCNVFGLDRGSVRSGRRVGQRSVPFGNTVLYSPSLDLRLYSDCGFTGLFALNSSAASHRRTLLDARSRWRQREVLRGLFSWLVGEFRPHRASHS